jgi:hypothetical protein
MHVLKTLFIERQAYKNLLKSPSSTVTRFYLNEFPIKISYFTLTAYKIRAPLVLSFLDDRFATDFLYWAAQAPKFEPMLISSESSQLVPMRRLVEGIFNFGDKIIILTLKVLVKGYLSEDNYIEFTVLDSMARMW